MTLHNLCQEWNKNCGKSRWCPAELEFMFKNEEFLEITLTRTPTSKSWRRLDTWGIAFLAEARRLDVQLPSTVRFRVGFPVGKSLKPKFEALKRRISYLALVQESAMAIELFLDDESIPLYSAKELVTRPENEIVGLYDSPRSEKHETTALEKRLQGFLFDTEKEDGIRTNERLAIFGADFFDLKERKYGIQREFPTGVFDGKINASNRILPTYFIDFVTVNRPRNIALVEIKVNDKSLEVIAQIMDYTLFFLAYQTKLESILKAKYSIISESHHFHSYIANNAFHERFDETFTFYSPRNVFAFSLKKITLGFTTEV